MDQTNFFSEFPNSSESDWMEEVLKKIPKEAFAQLKHRNYEEIDLNPFYTRASSPRPILDASDFPVNWQNRVRIEVDIPAEANEEAQESLKQGAEIICFDTRFTEKLYFSGICRGLENVALSWILPDHFEHVDSLGQWNGPGSIDYDYLSRWMLSGKQNPDASKVLHKLIHHSASKISQRALVINLQSFSEAGANAVQELGFGLSILVEYWDQLSELKVDFETLAKQSEFSVSIGENYFTEIAKFRALRILWRRILEVYVLKFRPAYVHARTGLRNKSAQDPYNNMLRTSTEAMSAVIGGVNFISVDPYDQKFRPADDFSKRIARNIPTVLKSEAHLAKVRDASLGSYYIEYLSQALAQEAWKLFQEVESQGGFQASFQSGFISREVQKIREKRQADIESKDKIWLGVNKYQNSDVEVESAPTLEKPPQPNKDFPFLF